MIIEFNNHFIIKSKHKYYTDIYVTIGNLNLCYYRKNNISYYYIYNPNNTIDFYVSDNYINFFNNISNTPKKIQKERYLDFYNYIKNHENRIEQLFYY